MLGWSEEGQEGVLWLGVVWASLSVLQPADGHSPFFGVKSWENDAGVSGANDSVPIASLERKLESNARAPMFEARSR